ncbi:MAG TPA: GNAT family N-acetyltransferase [Patescibacteria group bacterium]|nr:GNAT family N-acetyltransferase [Patescibacteria group bacterium]
MSVEIDYYREEALQPRKVDFRFLYAAIAKEPTLLHPALATLQASYDAGLAVVNIIDGTNIANGYSRIIPLFTEEQRQQLDLPNDLADIAELGTVFVHPDFRGRRIAEDLQRQLLQQVKPQIDDQNLLIIGTTKTLKFLHILDRMGEETGISFYHCRHTEFPHLAPVTCICEPDFGEGFQHRPDCTTRVTETQIFSIRDLLAQREKVTHCKEYKIPCTMFVSSESLAGELDKIIAGMFENRVTSQSEWVNRLIKNGYY